MVSRLKSLLGGEGECPPRILGVSSSSENAFHYSIDSTALFCPKKSENVRISGAVALSEFLCYALSGCYRLSGGR